METPGPQDPNASGQESGPQPNQPIPPPSYPPQTYPPPAQPQQQWPQPPGSPPGAYPGYGQTAYPVQVNGSTILLLGILSLVICSICGPFAWTMGNSALAAIDSGQADPSQRGNVSAGRICGIIGTVLLILFPLIWIGFFFLGLISAVMSHNH